MTFIDDDKVIRRNLVATSFGIIVVSWLGLPLNQLLSAMVPTVVIDVPTWKLIALAFAVLGYLCFRLETSAEAAAFHDGYRALHKEVMLQLFVKDWDRLANRYARGRGEHAFLNGRLSQLIEGWITVTPLSDYLVPQSQVFVRLEHEANFPFTANLAIKCALGSDDARIAPGEEKKFKFAVNAAHRRQLRRRATRHVYFRHPLGIQVIVPLCVCAVAYLGLFIRLAQYLLTR